MTSRNGGAPSGGAALAAVASLVRINNAMIFAVVCTALAATGYVQTQRAVRGSAAWHTTLIVLRIALPIAATALSAWAASVAIDRFLRGRMSAEVAPDAIAPAFHGSKLVAMSIFLTGAMLSAACLVFGFRVYDLLLLLLNFGMLVLSRPSIAALAQFAAAAESIRRETIAKERGDLDGGTMEEAEKEPREGSGP